MHKNLNQSTVKISYSCMNNISSVLSNRNKNILNPKQTSFGCNCRNKDNFSLDGECPILSTLYRAGITTDNDHKFYYGTSETTLSHDTKIILVTLNISVIALRGLLPQKHMVMLTHYHVNFV